MVNFIKLILGSLQTNCYLLFDDGTKECFIIDPANESNLISETIELKKLIPIGILLTHGHFDHAMAVMDLKLIYKIPIYANEKDLFLLKRIKKTAEFFLKMPVEVLDVEKVDIDLEKLTEINLGEEKIEVIKTPGHTPGSVCFYSAKQNILFSGDTLFSQGLRGGTDHAYSSTKEIYKSIYKLMQLPRGTTVLSGHGEETTIGSESERYVFNDENKR